MALLKLPLLLSISLLVISINPASARQSDIYCDDLDNQCTFVLLNGKTNKLIISNKKRAKTRMSPFSTFKIPNSLIALETGVVDDINAPISYSPEVYPSESWWPKSWYSTDHSLKNAFKHSVVPIYRTLAVQIGDTAMQSSLNAFNYGNRDISSGIDSFWLDKSIRISAIEQVQFLKNIHERTFDITNTHYDQLENVMNVENTTTYQLYAKTGGGQIAKSVALGWYVGYTVHDEVPYYFAFNMTDETFKKLQSKRVSIAKQSLVRYGALPVNALD